MLTENSAIHPETLDLFAEIFGAAAILPQRLCGDWKLVAAGEAAPWELHDLRANRSESKNLASA